MSEKSNNAGSAGNESESLKAARNLPPGWSRDSSGKSPSSGGMSFALPLLISVGGAVAAGLLAEKKGQYVSRAARSARDHAEDYYDSAYDSASHLAHDAQAKASDWSDSLLAQGAKIAGVAGLLKSLGSGKLNSKAAFAAKAIAAKKIAEYAASGGASAGRFAKRHPAMTAAGSGAALRARSAAHEGSSRLHDAYSVIRHGRDSVQDRNESNAGTYLATGLTIAGIGAAAIYLFHPEQGEQRRRMLRENLIGKSQSAASALSGAYHSTASQVGEVYQTAQTRGAEYYKVAKQQVSDVADATKQKVSDVAETAKLRASDVAEAAKAVVKTERPTDEK